MERTIRDKIRDLRTKGAAYQGALKDLEDVLRWADDRMERESGTTHWEDCWRVHPRCSIRIVEDLQAQVRRVHESLEGLSKLLDAALKRVVQLHGETR